MDLQLGGNLVSFQAEKQGIQGETRLRCCYGVQTIMGYTSFVNGKNNSSSTVSLAKVRNNSDDLSHNANN
jgi:hypothetical protein